MISVIIPIYNLEKYLSRCFEHLMCQNNKDFEVILVNDGSLDLSEPICRKQTEIDKRFKLINKKNGGVSSARNIGLKHALGEWIVFIDGDDIVDEDFLTLPINANEKQIDVIEKSFFIRNEDQVLLRNSIIEDETITSNSRLLKYYSDYIQSNSATLCNKLIKRDIIGAQTFDETKKMGEDFIFFLSIISRVNVYFKMSHGSYTYIRRSTSAASTIDADKKNRIKILFSNLSSIREITTTNGISNLGDCIIYTIYYPYLLRLKNYLSIRDWLKVFKLWATFPFCDLRLMTKFQKKQTIIGFPKTIIKALKANDRQRDL